MRIEITVAVYLDSYERPDNSLIKQEIEVPTEGVKLIHQKNQSKGIHFLIKKGDCVFYLHEVPFGNYTSTENKEKVTCDQCRRLLAEGRELEIISEIGG